MTTRLTQGGVERMTQTQIKAVAKAIFAMRVNRVERPSPADLNKKRMVVRKQIEDRRYQMAMNRWNDELAG